MDDVLTGPKLDSIRQVETPEGVGLELRLAGPIPRVLAFALDWMIRTMGVAVLAIPLAFLGEAGMGLTLLVMFLAEWFYPVVFELFWDGSTPGKKALGLQVLTDDGTPVTWSSSILRNLLRFADFLPFGYQIGLISMSASEGSQRLGDLAAGTVVVYRDRAHKTHRLPSGPAERVPLPLDVREQRAIVDFAERADTWGTDRSEELASLIPALAGKTPKRRVERLMNMARWLTGQR